MPPHAHKRASSSAQISPFRKFLLGSLSAAAGCVDAIVFVAVGVFPANMTGNTVLLATGFLRSDSASFHSLLALSGFFVGAAMAAWTTRSFFRTWVKIPRLIGICGAGILAATIGVAYFGRDFDVAFILITSAAMGVQSGAVQQLGISGVSTVFVTGTFTASARNLAVPGSAKPHTIRWLPASTWICYFLGASIGGVAYALHIPFPLILPAIAFLGLAFIEIILSWDSHVALASNEHVN